MNTLQTIITNSITPWALSSGLKIVGIVFLAYLIRKFSGAFIEKTIRKVIISDNFGSKEAEEKRENTLIKIINGIVSIAVLLVAVLMILDEIGVAIGPLLAAAGIAGIAFGFGGQYLIRDLISGLFIILENQYRVGDIVCFDSTCGAVEDLTLRMTTLRNLDGVVFHVPHGEVKTVSNLSKGFSRVNLNIGIGYESDIEKVAALVNNVGNELAADPKWKEHIIKAPQFVRIDDFADSAINIKIVGDTQPAQQWAVTGELRMRLKIAFDKEGINIPFPQVVVHQAVQK